MSRTAIEKKLRRHGVQPTSQRVEVGEVLLHRPQHMSADQILLKLHQRGSKVSKATVYNCLNLFAEKGLLREICVDGQRKYYDSLTEAHHHFYHVETGRLTDIPPDYVEISNLPPLPKGTETDGVEVVIRVRSKE